MNTKTNQCYKVTKPTATQIQQTDLIALLANKNIYNYATETDEGCKAFFDLLIENK